MKISVGMQQCQDCHKCFELWRRVDEGPGGHHNGRQIRCVECAEKKNKERSRARYYRIKEAYEYTQ